MEDHLLRQMMSMRWRRAGIVALVMPIAIGCRGEKVEPADILPMAHIELDSSRTVEVIGLRRWTVDMLRDSLKKYAPDDSLESDATAANLRNLLGFADAAMTVNTVVFDEDEKTTITIAVREPGDSARVHYAPQDLDSLPKLGDWKAIAIPFAGDSDAHLLNVVASAHLEGASRLVVDSTVRGRKVTHREGYVFESPADSLASRPILEQLRARTTDRDLTTAVATVDTSSTAPDRVVAVLVLANFPSRDAAWRALLKAAVGREQGRDAATAQRALIALSDRFARPVDWTPMTATIHDVLDGTALGALAPLAAALSATGAVPAQAKAYLANGGEMLTAYLESDNPSVRDPAHTLLIALRGQDLGLEVEPWRRWIATLQQGPSESAR